MAEEVFVPELSDAYRQIGEHAAPHCDAALASAARALRHDLDGEDSSVGAGRPAAVEAATGVLSAAGGIVGSSLLSPGDWP